MKNKSIIIGEKTHSELVKIANSHSSTLGKVVEEMIYYFKRTGINPNDTTKDNPTAGMKILDKRVVSFFKKQESDILKPMKDDIFKCHEENLSAVKSLRNDIYERIDSLIEEHEGPQKNYLLLINDKSKKILEKLNEIENEIKEYKNAGFFTKLKRLFGHANK